MRKIDLILENIRDEYMINLLEEGEVTELETLKTKKFLNESLGRIRGLLVEEGTMDAVKNNLKNNWGKYLAGAGTAAGAGYLAMHPELQQDLVNQGGQAVRSLTGQETIGDKWGEFTRWLTDNENTVDKAGNIIDKAGNIVGQATDYVGDKVNDALDFVSDKAKDAGDYISNKAEDAGDYLNDKVEDAGDYAKEQYQALDKVTGGYANPALAAGAAGLAGAGYGAKKLADRYRR